MSTNSLLYIYPRIHNALALHTEHSVCVYTSRDGLNFDAYPSPIFGSSISTDFTIVLPELRARFAIQVSNIYTRDTVHHAPWPLDEVDLDPSYSVRIVDIAQDLAHSLHYQQASFIRTDGSLVVWGDDEEAILSTWTEIIYRVQNRSSIAVPTTAAVANPLAGNIPSNGANLEDFMLWGNYSLPYLNELASLPIPDFSPSPSPDPQGYSVYHPWQTEFPEGSLGLALPSSASSPFSEATSASFTDSPSTTADLESFPPSYAPRVYIGDEEETGSNLSFDFDFSALTAGTSDNSSSNSSNSSSSSLSNAVSPTLSSSQCTITSSAGLDPFAFATIGQNTHEDEDGEEEGEEANYVPQPIINANANGAGNDDGAAAAATTTTIKNEDVVSDHLRGTIMPVSNSRVLKRSRSVVASAGGGSAPARLTVPLPDVEQHDYSRRKFLAIAPALPLASLASTSSTPVPVPVPAFPSSPSTSAPSPSSPTPTPTPAARSRRRRSTTTTTTKRTKRHPCEYNCGKTFSRLQDQERHSKYTCNANPDRAGVDCPECGQVLSRLDAAQRHWRGHENPTCAPPSGWVSSRA